MRVRPSQSATLPALLCALLAACDSAPPSPPPGSVRMPLKPDPRDVNATPGSPNAPPPPSAFGVQPNPPQAPRMPLREGDPNAPVSVATCADDWLARHNLNPYGDPQGTLYAGGTPLFNERTGERVDRLDYLFARNAELRATCAPTKK